MKSKDGILYQHNFKTPAQQGYGKKWVFEPAESSSLMTKMQSCEVAGFIMPHSVLTLVLPIENLL